MTTTIAAEPSPPPAAPAATPVPRERRHQESKAVVIVVCVCCFLVVGGIAIGLYQKGGYLLNQLQETAASRGLITFLVAVVTVSIALVVAVWVMASDAESDVLKTRFAFAKDVLATLVGILGTILGFYFGSADKAGSDFPVLADPQLKGGQLIAHATGGTAPFRFVISGLDGPDGAVTRTSKDGWVFEQVPPSVKSGASLTVEVIDAKERRTSRAVTYEAPRP